MSHDESSELLRLQEECQSMANLLKKLEAEELGLRAQNSILAREVINFGGQRNTLNPPGSGGSGSMRSSTLKTKRKEHDTDAFKKSSATNQP